MATMKPPPVGRYVDPFVDYAFKRIFGSEPNKDLLIDFLNGVFRGRKIITDLSYNTAEHPGDLNTEGSAIFDLLCTGTDGESFIIEIQRGRQAFFKERALFYTSRLISGQAPKGKRAQWAYNLKEIYLIALLEDSKLNPDDSNAYLHDICLCNRDTGKIFYDKLNYTYIELINFVKGETELDTDLDRWLHVLKNMSRWDKLPLYLRKPIFEKLFNIAEYTNFTKEEKDMYDSSMKYKWDNQAVLDYARMEGLERGRLEGKLEGKVEGKLEQAKAIAREMKKDGLPLAQIAKFTNLSVIEIEKL